MSGQPKPIVTMDAINDMGEVLSVNHAQHVCVPPEGSQTGEARRGAQPSGLELLRIVALAIYLDQHMPVEAWENEGGAL